MSIDKDERDGNAKEGDFIDEDEEKERDSEMREVTRKGESRRVRRYIRRREVFRVVREGVGGIEGSAEDRRSRLSLAVVQMISTLRRKLKA